MEIVTGNLWDELGKSEVVLVSTNNFVRRDGLLVMGRGAAREAATMFTRLRFDLGTEIRKQHAQFPAQKTYGIIVLHDRLYRHFPNTKLGAFQVKYHFAEPARTELIRASAEMLHDYIKETKRSVAMNFPGIGNGQLAEVDVLPILEHELGNVPVKVYKR